MLNSRGVHIDLGYLTKVCTVYRERIKVIHDLLKASAYLFGEIPEYDKEAIQKMWNDDLASHFKILATQLSEEDNFTAERLHEIIPAYVKSNGLKMGTVLQMIRTAISGSPSGPDVYQMLELLGKEKVLERMSASGDKFRELL